MSIAQALATEAGHTLQRGAAGGRGYVARQAVARMAADAPAKSLAKHLTKPAAAKPGLWQRFWAGLKDAFTPKNFSSGAETGLTIGAGMSLTHGGQIGVGLQIGPGIVL